MPGFDGTGPSGMGPLTGGGRGYCVVAVASGANYSYGRGTQDYNNFYDSSYYNTPYGSSIPGNTRMYSGYARSRGRRFPLRGRGGRGRRR